MLALEEVIKVATNKVTYTQLAGLVCDLALSVAVAVALMYCLVVLMSSVF